MSGACQSESPSPGTLSIMSASQTTGPEPAHDHEAASRLFRQWHVYRSIIDANWMFHREIFRAVRAWTLARHPGPFTLLDLGCGDASFIRGTFDDSGLYAYTGIDASEPALAEARDRLAGAGFETRLVAGDMLACLREGTATGRRNVDIILASYAIHHLPSPEKSELLRHVHAQLSPHGALLYADIFRRNAESREEFLAGYVAMMRQSWTGMAGEDLASAVEHVHQRDIPESVESLTAMARDAGLAGAAELFRDDTGFHRLLVFEQPRVTRGAGFVVEAGAAPRATAQTAGAVDRHG